MIRIDDEMRKLIDSARADGVPCVLGTASREGVPQVSIKGSTLVYDQETLAYWERSKRSALANIGHNPNVVILYRNPEKGIDWRFHGTATVHEAGPIREELMRRTVQAELDQDPERQGVAVLLKLNRIADLSGNLLQQRDEVEQ